MNESQPTVENQLPDQRSIYTAIIADVTDLDLNKNLLKLIDSNKSKSNPKCLIASLELLLLNGYSGTEALQQIACFLSQQNRHEEACYFFQQCILQDEKRSKLVDRLYIKSLWHLRKFSEIINYYENSIKQNTADTFMMRNVGMSYYHLSLFSKAYQVLSLVKYQLLEDVKIQSILDQIHHHNKHILCIMNLEQDDNKSRSTVVNSDDNWIQQQINEIGQELDKNIRSSNSNNTQPDLTSRRDHILSTLWKRQDQVTISIPSAVEHARFWNHNNVGLSKLLQLVHPMTYATKSFYQNDIPVDESLTTWLSYHDSILTEIETGNIEVSIAPEQAAYFNLSKLIFPYPFVTLLNKAERSYAHIAAFSRLKGNHNYLEPTSEDITRFSKQSDAIGLKKFGDLDKVKQIYLDLLKEDPSQSNICYKLLALPAKLFSEAEIQQLDTTVMNQTDDVDLWNTFGVFISAIDEKRSLELFDKTLLTYGDQFSTLFLIGVRRTRMGDHVGAIEALTSAIQLRPYDVQTIIELTDVHQKLNNTENSYKILDEAIFNRQILDKKIISRLAHVCVSQERFDLLQSLVIAHSDLIEFKPATWLSWAVKFERLELTTGLLICLTKYRQQDGTNTELSSKLDKWVNKRKFQLKAFIA